jgi:glucokinase
MNSPSWAGFDLGGTQLKFGLVDSSGALVYKDKAPTPVSIEELIVLLKIIWADLKKKERSIAACGFGFPGIYSLRDRKIFQSPNYSGLDNFDLYGALSGFVDVPFWVDNDANMAAYGEWAYGAGRKSQSLVLLTIGTGIGSGVILDGQLWHGKCGFAGELGHVVVNSEGEMCNCGVRGCLETESSAPRIVGNYLRLTQTQEILTSEDIYFRAKRGDEAARQSFARAGYYLGIGLGIVINFLNPETILLGGGVMTTGEYLFFPAVEEAKRRSYKASFACCKIERATLGNDAGLIGAASWAKSQALPRDRN